MSIYEACGVFGGLFVSRDEGEQGFSYVILDRYTREGLCQGAPVNARIGKLHPKNRFEQKGIPAFQFHLEEIPWCGI